MPFGPLGKAYRTLFPLLLLCCTAALTCASLPTGTLLSLPRITCVSLVPSHSRCATTLGGVFLSANVAASLPRVAHLTLSIQAARLQRGLHGQKHGLHRHGCGEQHAVKNQSTFLVAYLFPLQNTILTLAAGQLSFSSGTLPAIESLRISN